MCSEILPMCSEILPMCSESLLMCSEFWFTFLILKCVLILVCVVTRTGHRI